MGRNAEDETGGVIVPITDGESILRREKREISLLVARDEVAITHARYAAGEKVAGPHVHGGHTDAFYVLEGELTFEIGREAETIVVSAGGFVAAPPKVAHSFRNDSDRPARWLTIHAHDGGFAAFMRGVRDGDEVAWDISAVPAGGGLSASEAIVSPEGGGERVESGNRVCWLRCDLPDIYVVEAHLHGAHPDLLLERRGRRVVSWLVVEGELDTTIAGARETVGPGRLISIPPRVEGTLYCRASERARILSLHTPGRSFADYPWRAGVRTRPA